MKVKVKGKGVKLSGKWCFKNEEVEIDEAEYEKNKEYVAIIKEDTQEPLIPEIPGEDIKLEELKLLREKGKKLEIKNAHVMGKEKLEQLIKEKEAELSETEKETSQDTNTEQDSTETEQDTNLENSNEEEKTEKEQNPEK